jgi:membrane protein
MRLWNFLKELFNNWSQDRVSSKAAALAYYTIFSLAPILLICISVIGIVYGEEAARGEVLTQVSNLIGKESALQIQEIIQKASNPSTALFTKIMSFIILLFTASGVFTEIQQGVNDIWGVKVNPKVGWFKIVKSRFMTFLMVLGIAFLLLISLILSACLAILSKYLSIFMSTSVWMDLVIGHLLSFFIITLLFAMMYKIIPDIVLRWRDVWFGAIITSLLFSIGKMLIEFYLARFLVTSIFGAAGSFIIILVWVFYSSQIFFIGVEITKLFSKNKGKKIITRRNAKKNKANVKRSPY